MRSSEKGDMWYMKPGKVDAHANGDINRIVCVKEWPDRGRKCYLFLTRKEAMTLAAELRRGADVLSLLGGGK